MNAVVSSTHLGGSKNCEVFRSRKYKGGRDGGWWEGAHKHYVMALMSNYPLLKSAFFFFLREKKKEIKSQYPVLSTYNG